MTPEDEEYFGAMFRLQAQALNLKAKLLRPKAKEVRFQIGEPNEPEPRECRKNVYRFVAEHADHSPVPGWATYPGLECCRFVAHYVVQNPSGDLIDITPIREEDRRGLCFVPHAGTCAEFESIIKRMREAGVHEVWYPRADPPSSTNF